MRKMIVKGKIQSILGDEILANIYFTRHKSTFFFSFFFSLSPSLFSPASFLTCTKVACSYGAISLLN